MEFAFSAEHCFLNNLSFQGRHEFSPRLVHVVFAMTEWHWQRIPSQHAGLPPSIRLLNHQQFTIFYHQGLVQ